MLVLPLRDHDVHRQSTAFPWHWWPIADTTMNKGPSYDRDHIANCFCIFDPGTTKLKELSSITSYSLNVCVSISSTLQNGLQDCVRGWVVPRPSVIGSRYRLWRISCHPQSIDDLQLAVRISIRLLRFNVLQKAMLISDPIEEYVCSGSRWVPIVPMSLISVFPLSLISRTMSCFSLNDSNPMWYTGVVE